MNAITLMREIAALSGYTIDASTGSDPANKTRALRRLNAVKADIISRYGAKWKAGYREGWLPLSAVYNTGTATFTQNSISVSGSGTSWTTSMVGQKIQGGDNAYYEIANVPSASSLELTQPYQGTTISGQVYQIWQDTYFLYPEVWSVGGFIDYFLPQRMTEAWPTNMKESYPFPTNVEEPTVYTVLHRNGLSSLINTGTISVAINDNIWTGSGTSWNAGNAKPVQPGMILTVNGINYTVKHVTSDTQLETYQLAVTVQTNATYTLRGKNIIAVRFRKPTTQRIVHYWYYVKDNPFVNDNDEDWVAEMFPEVILNGAVLKDYLDKNDVARASLSKNAYEDSIKNMKVSDENAYTGIRTLGIYVPPEARE